MQIQWIDRMNISNQPQSKNVIEAKLSCGLKTTELFIHFEYLKSHETLDADLYSQQLQCVHENQRKRLALINRRNVLYVNNASYIQQKSRRKLLDSG